MINQTRTAPKPKTASPIKAAFDKGGVVISAKGAPDQAGGKKGAPQKAISEKAASSGKATTNKPMAVVPMDYETFLTKLGPRDRLNIERHIATCEGEADSAHCTLWKRVATLLMTLAPQPPKTTGQQAIQFFIPDGKYRMQVFALHDQSDLKLSLYVSTTLDDVFKAGILTGPKLAAEKGMSYPIVSAPGQMLTVEELDGKSADPSPFYKDMLGWNRKAIRVTLITTATNEQMAATEQICNLAAGRWNK